MYKHLTGDLETSEHLSPSIHNHHSTTNEPCSLWCSPPVPTHRAAGIVYLAVDSRGIRFTINTTPTPFPSCPLLPPPPLPRPPKYLSGQHIFGPRLIRGRGGTHATCPATYHYNQSIRWCLQLLLQLLFLLGLIPRAGKLNPSSTREVGGGVITYVVSHTMPTNTTTSSSSFFFLSFSHPQRTRTHLRDVGSRAEGAAPGLVWTSMAAQPRC